MKSDDIDLIWKYLEGECSKEEADLIGNRLQHDHLFTKLYTEQSEIYQSLCKTETIEFRRILQKVERELKKRKSGYGMILLNYTWLLAAAIGIILISTGNILLRSLTDVPAATPVATTSQIGEPGDFTPFDTLVLPRVSLEKPINLVITDEAMAQKDFSSSEQPPLAECFEPIPLLEELIDVQYRSARIIMTSPANGSTFSKYGHILFRYDTAVLTDSIFLTIMNNLAQVMVENPLIDSEYMLEPDLEEGLYYFQFITRDEILCTGKFFIK